MRLIDANVLKAGFEEDGHLSPYIEEFIDAFPTQFILSKDNTLIELLEACENIKYGAPKTLREVCQWTAFFNCASRIYTRDGAGFQLDVLLYPYYEKDIREAIPKRI